MIEPGGGFRLLDEAVHPLLVVSDIRRENLEGNDAFLLRVVSQVDFAHPTRAEMVADFVIAQKISGGDGHTSTSTCERLLILNRNTPHWDTGVESTDFSRVFRV